MLRLDSASRKLQAVLAGAVTTKEPDVIVAFVDSGRGAVGTWPRTTKLSTTSGASAVDICDAPGQIVVRDIAAISVHNNDTASITVTIRMNDNGAAYNLLTVTLATGETLEYNSARGWRVLTATGELRQ